MKVESREYPSMIGDFESRFFIDSIAAAFEPLAAAMQEDLDQLAREYMYRGSIWYVNGFVSHFYLNQKGKEWLCITETEERYLGRVEYIKVSGEGVKIVESEKEIS